MRSPTRTAITAVLTALILGLAGAIAWRQVQLDRGLTVRFDFHQPGLRAARVTVPGRPHDIVEFEHPERIRRHVTFSVSTDSHGFRGREIALEKPAGVFRVMAVGECVTLGVGVDDSETWPAQLEALLRERLPGRTVEVVNAGRTAPPQEILGVAQREAFAFSPDVLVVSPGASTVFYGHHTGREPFSLYAPPERYEADLAELGVLLARVAAESRARGAHLVFVTPTMNSFFLPDGQRWADATLAAGTTLGVPVLDTTTAFQAEERREGLVLETTAGVQRLLAFHSGRPTPLLEAPVPTDGHLAPAVRAWLDDHPEVGPALSIDDNHPNARGHRLIASLMLDLLIGQGWLPEPSER
jgi:hypothetical protein